MSIVATLSVSVACAAEPPLCDDPRVLAQLRLAYDSVVEVYQLQPLEKLGSPEEIAILQRVPSADASKSRITPVSQPGPRSRFCRASLKLASGGRDSVHFRIDEMIGRPENEYQLTPCFDSVLAHESVPEDEYAQCAGYR